MTDKIQYSYSYDGEIYHGSFDTKEQAFIEADRESVYIGEDSAIVPKDYFPTLADIIEGMESNMLDDVNGDILDGSGPHITPELEADFENALLNFFKKHDLHWNCYKILNAKKYSKADYNPKSEVPNER